MTSVQPMSQRPRTRGHFLACLSPLAFSAVGFGLGWYFHWRYHLKPPSEAYDVSARLFMLWFGILGWAVGTVARGSKLYCGGREPIRKSQAFFYLRRYAVGVAVVVVASILAASSLADERWSLYAVSVFTMFVLLVGEVGWEWHFR